MTANLVKILPISHSEICQEFREVGQILTLGVETWDTDGKVEANEGALMLATLAADSFDERLQLSDRLRL